jgi:hypothetical protein
VDEDSLPGIMKLSEVDFAILDVSAIVGLAFFLSYVHRDNDRDASLYSRFSPLGWVVLLLVVVIGNEPFWGPRESGWTIALLTTEVLLIAGLVARFRARPRK